MNSKWYLLACESRNVKNVYNDDKIGNGHFNIYIIHQTSKFGNGTLSDYENKINYYKPTK